MDERSPPAPLVPVGTDFLKYLSVNADEELPPTCGWRPCMCHRSPGAARTGVGGGVCSPGHPALGLHPEEELQVLCPLVSCT